MLKALRRTAGRSPAPHPVPLRSRGCNVILTRGSGGPDPRQEKNAHRLEADRVAIRNQLQTVRHHTFHQKEQKFSPQGGSPSSVRSLVHRSHAWHTWAIGGLWWAFGIDDVEVMALNGTPPWEYTIIEEFDFNECDGGFVHLCPPNDPNTCPDGIDDWQWGMPGYPGPEPGEITCDSVPLTNCWGTILAGNYNNVSCSRLVSPIVTLPDTCDSLILEICHWYDIETNYDGGNVVIFDPPDPYDAAPAMNPISPNGGKLYDGVISSSTSFFACLTDLEDGFMSHMSPPWYQSYFDISMYGGLPIRFGFDFGSDASVTYPGWYIKWARVWCVREPVAVDEDMTKDVHGYILNQAVPNPFTGMTNVSFSLPVGADVDLKVFDASGRVVRTLADGVMPEGSHTVSWDGRDESGVRAPAGIYFYRMQAGQFDAIRKLVLLR